jgi:hypothetical protein
MKRARASAPLIIADDRIARLASIAAHAPRRFDCFPSTV